MSSKIKSLKRYNRIYKNFSFADLTSGDELEYLELTAKLDEKGHVVEEAKYIPDGSLEEKNTYSFDDRGKLASHTLLYAIDNVTEKRVLTRNSKGLLENEIKYYGDDPGEKISYEYDDKENVKAIVHYDEEGLFISRDEMKYDEKGSLAERCAFNADNKLTSRITFSPPTENQIEETEYNEKGAVVSVTKLRFNEKGKEISSVQTTPEGKLIASVHSTYDDRGNVIEKKYKDFYSKFLKYEYDEKDRLLVQELFDENGMLLRKNMYEYDDDGNVLAEQSYEMDTTRGGRDKHFGTRYEYEFY